MTHRIWRPAFIDNAGIGGTRRKRMLLKTVTVSSIAFVFGGAILYVARDRSRVQRVSASTVDVAMRDARVVSYRRVVRTFQGRTKVETSEEVGVFDFARQVGSAHVTVSGAKGIDLVRDGTVEYSRGDASALPDRCRGTGRVWERVVLQRSNGSRLSGRDLLSTTSPSPFGTVEPLTVLEQAGADLHVVGKVERNGVATTEYDVRVDHAVVNRVAPLLRTVGNRGLSATLWLDSHSRLGELSTRMDGPVMLGSPFALDIDVQFTFGKGLTATPDPAHVC